MHDPVDELARRLDLTTTALTAVVEERLRIVFDDLGRDVAVVAVIIPRCPKVEDLRSRVQKRSYARCADEHLVAGAVRAAVTRMRLSVMVLSPADALRRAHEHFGLDRQALGIEADRARAGLGDDFEYHHRLPALAARVARIATER